MAKIRVNYRLDAELAEAIGLASKATGVGKTEIVQRALRNHLGLTDESKPAGQEPAVTKRRPAVRQAAKVDGGQKSVAPPISFEARVKQLRVGAGMTRALAEATARGEGLSP